MPGRGRLRAVGVAALVLALGLAVGGNRPSALAAPSTFQIVGGGYGHGIGMSQYGAHGMALRGATAGRIISFYHGGAAARPAAGGATARPATSQVFVDRTPPPSGTSTGGFSAGAWTVSNVNAEQRSTSSGAFTSYRWGKAGDLPVVGDWDGDGIHTVGIVRPNATTGGNHFLLRNSDGSVTDFWYGAYGDRPVVGDWDGDGVWTPGAVRAGVWSLRNTNTTGAADVTFRFGRSGDRYLAGDWDGDGDFTPAVQRAGTFWFRNAATTGPSDFHLRFGRVEDLGFVGDWNGNGTWTPGVLRAGPSGT